MIKKLIIGTLAVAMIGGLVLGRDFMSYARTFCGKARDAVRSNIDMDLEVDRARDMIERLNPEIEKCRDIIFEQQVTLRRMEKKVQLAEAELNKEQETILAERDQLRTDLTKFVVHRISYTRAQIERDLARRVDKFKAQTQNLNRDKQIMMAQREKLLANQQTLQNMVGEKKKLEVAIAQLDARMEQLKAEETVSSIQFDDSELARVKTLIDELNTRIDVREAKMDAEGNYDGLIPFDTKARTDRDIATEVDELFNQTPGTDNAGQTAELNDAA